MKIAQNAHAQLARMPHSFTGRTTPSRFNLATMAALYITMSVPFWSAVAGPTGKGMMTNFDLKDREQLPNVNQTDYSLVRQSPYVIGAYGRFTWAELEPAEGALNWAPIDDFAAPWIADGKKLAISVETSPDGVPGWLYSVYGVPSVIGEPPVNRVYPVYWNTTYQQKFGAFLTALAARYGNDPNVELFVMGRFGEGITEHPVDNDSGTELSHTFDQWIAAGAYGGVDDWFLAENGVYINAIISIRQLWRTAFPTQQLVTRVHDPGKTPDPFESTLRSDSLAKGYALTNDGANSNVSPESRTDLLTFSGAVKVGWISFTGREKKAGNGATLSQVTGGNLPARTDYVQYTWVIAGVGESTPSRVQSLAVSAANRLRVTVPGFPTEVTSVNIYAGPSTTSITLQGSVTLDGGSWTEPKSGITTTGVSPPTVNTAIGSVLDLFHHIMGIDGDPKLDPSAHVSYIFRELDALIKSVPGTSQYVAGDPEKYEAGLVWAYDNFWPDNVAPTVRITSPLNGAIYSEPATITIAADASDADGAITKVEFFQGATKLGEALSAPYTFTWANVVIGAYSLTAQAADNQGAVTTSSAVSVTVNALPTLTVSVSDSSASEPGTNTGKFKITRTGSTAAALTVNYAMSGTATKGADYKSLSGSVNIKAGSTSATITLTPLDDTLKEGSETVTLPISGSPSYFIGSPSNGTVTITDND